MINVKKIFTGGINSDDDARLIDDDAYLNLIDGRMAISGNGRNKRLENIKGTTLLDNNLLPVGNNFCIGTAVDRARGWVLRFNWNSEGEHGIYAHEKSTGTNYIVLLNSNIIAERVACSMQFFGGGSNYGTTATYTYSGYAVTGDNYQISFQEFLGIPNFGVSVTVLFSETLAEALVRLVAEFNTNSVAIANGLTATLVGTNINFDFNGNLWLGSNLVNLATQTNKPLNFSKSHRINRNAKVIGDLLYWTDNYNQPRKVNIIAGIKTNQPSYVTDVEPYQIPIDYKVISWIKKPPIYPITWEKQTDSPDVSINLIENEAFFFTYNYEYRDNEISALASFSKLVAYNKALTYYNSPSISNLKDVYNLVYLQIPVTEKIEQDVQRINIYAKYGENGKTFLIKTFDKDNEFDAGAIVNHNKSNTTSFLEYYFRNNARGVSFTDISENDLVPLLTKTIETAKNRLFLANNLLGYNTPTKTSLTFSNNLVSLTNPNFVTGFRFNSPYKGCVSFYDEFKRKCGSIVDGSIFYTYNDKYWQASPTIVDKINWTLSNDDSENEIPDWAYYYSIDLTKNLETSFFLTGLAEYDTVKYVIKEVDGTFTYTNSYSASHYGFAISTFGLTLSQKGYILNEGDYCYLEFAQTGLFYKRKVLATDGVYVIVDLIDAGLLPLSTSNVLKFTLITPIINNLQDFFYEKGVIYDISNPTEITRTYSEISGEIEGDVFLYTTGGTISGKKAIMEEMSPNVNRYKEWQTNSGFINEVDAIGQKRLATTLTFSDTYINGTRVNGLNKFQPLNRKDIGNTSTEIQNLVLTNKKQEDGTVMLIVTENEVLSAYLSEVQIVGATSNSSLATANEVIGTINALKLNSGTLNPESVFEYMGEVFWFDRKNGFLSQYSVNGVSPQSDYKLNRFFKRYAEDYSNTNASVIENINGFSHIPMCIDPYHREVMVTLPALIYENYAETLPSYSSVPPYTTSIINRFDVYDKLGKTMALDFQQNKWRCNYSFMPEWMEQVDNQLFLFKNGEMYSHSTNESAYNTYFGVQYPMRLCAVWNIKELPSAIKDVFEIAIEGNATPNWSVLYSPYPNIQISDLVAGDYKDVEGVKYANWYRDRISPNTGTSNPDKNLYKGDFMKSATPYIMLEFDEYNSLIYINFVQMGFGISKGTQMLLNK